jgi:hypothetical protein
MWAMALPNCMANSPVIGSTLAIPLIPSVPNNLRVICFTPLENPAAFSGDEGKITFKANTGFKALCKLSRWKFKDLLTGFTRFLIPPAPFRKGERVRIFSMPYHNWFVKVKFRSEDVNLFLTPKY